MYMHYIFYVCKSCIVVVVACCLYVATVRRLGLIWRRDARHVFINVVIKSRPLKLNVFSVMENSTQSPAYELCDWRTGWQTVRMTAIIGPIVCVHCRHGIYT